MTTFTVEVSSPEDLRDAFIKWLDRQQEITASSVFVKERERTILRTAYKNAAQFWRDVVIIQTYPSDESD